MRNMVSMQILVLHRHSSHDNNDKGLKVVGVCRVALVEIKSKYEVIN